MSHATVPNDPYGGAGVPPTQSDGSGYLDDSMHGTVDAEMHRSIHGEAMTATASRGASASRGSSRHAARGPLPPLPRLGLPEERYVHAALKAERNGDDLVFEAAKVGQYVTLAIRDPDLSWSQKLKYFRHALKRHCQAPEHADQMTKQWFARLASFVRGHCGKEALRLAAEMDDCYEARRSMGQTSEEIADDAEKFFDAICPYCDTCPPVYNDEEWRQLRMLRDRWI